MDPSPPPPLVEPHYVGATVALAAELGTEGGARASASGEVFTGMQLGRWIAVEGFFTYHASQAFQESASGEPCRSAPLDQWSLMALGSRLWIHLVHLRVVSVAIAPRLAMGMAFGHQEGFTNFRVPSCSRSTQSRIGWSFDGGIDFGLELRPISWLGVRTMLATGVGGAQAGFLSFGALTIGWSIGPVFRF
jgi:hypothetical protein